MLNAVRRRLACALVLCLIAAAGVSSPAAAEAVPKEAASGKAVFRCVGDLILHMPIVDSARTADGGCDFRPILAPVAGLIGGADYTVANVDGVMGASEEYTGYPRCSSPIQVADALLEAGVDMLTMANNHALDYGFSGLTAQMDACDARGMDHIGAARTQQEHDAPQLREINGIRVGFLNYTTHANGREAHCEPEAAAFGLRFAFKSDFAADAQALRDAGAEVIIAFMHWGAEYSRQVDGEENVLASRLVAAGVDVIVGGHPHVIQQIRWLEGRRSADGAPQRTLCCFSLGNFLSNQQAVHQNCGVIFEFTLERDAEGTVTVHSPGYIPVYVWLEKTEQGNVYRLIATERFLENPPEGMSEASFSQLRVSWKYTTALLDAGDAACIHIR